MPKFSVDIDWAWVSFVYGEVDYPPRLINITNGRYGVLFDPKEPNWIMSQYFTHDGILWHLVRDGVVPDVRGHLHYTAVPA